MYSVLGESPIMNSGEVSALTQITGSHTDSTHLPHLPRKLFVRTFWWFSQDVNRQAELLFAFSFQYQSPMVVSQSPSGRNAVSLAPLFFMGYRKNMIVLEYISKIIQRPDVLSAQLF